MSTATLRTGSQLAEAGLADPSAIEQIDAIGAQYSVAIPAKLARLIDPADPDTYLYSGNMHDIAKANGWWDGTGLLHWTQATA